MRIISFIVLHCTESCLLPLYAEFFFLGIRNHRRKFVWRCPIDLLSVSTPFARSLASSQNLKRHYLKSLPRRRLSMLGTNPPRRAVLCSKQEGTTPFHPPDRRISSGLQIARYFLPSEILKLIKRKRFFPEQRRLLVPAIDWRDMCCPRGQGRPEREIVVINRSGSWKSHTVEKLPSF